MNILKHLSLAVGRDFNTPTVSVSSDQAFIFITERPNFKAEIGLTQIPEEHGKLCGDTAKYFTDGRGRFIMLISDGMGSGEKARECSKITLRLVKQMLSAGFNGEETVKLINSRMNLSQNKEMYSSLDISILDLFAGKIELLKNGACNTYIKNKKTIKQIKSENLPVGIVNDIELQSNTIDINDGDILVVLCPKLSNNL